MRPGYFFELMPDSDLSTNQAIFRYTRFMIGDDFPIYLVLGQEKLEVCLSIPGQYGHTTMFEFVYSDYQNPRGKLSGQLIDVPTRLEFSFMLESIHSSSCRDLYQKSSSAVNTGAPFLSYSHATDEDRYCKGQLFTIEKRSSNQREVIGQNDSFIVSILYISTQHIFLDFLFDLKHSDVFNNSRHFDRLMLISRENYIFSSILKLLESKYWRSVNYPQAEGIDDNLLSEFSKSERTSAVKNWVKTLIDHRTTALVNSGWISRPLEDELYETLTSEIEDLPTKKDEREDPLWEEITEWSVSRFSYRRILALLLPFRVEHIIIFIIPWLLLGGLVLCCPYGSEYLECEGEDLSSILARRILLILSLIISFGAIIYSLNSDQYHKSDKNLFKSILHLISPRILISGLIGWTLVGKIFFPKTIPGLEVLSWLYFFLLIGCLAIPTIYLSHELSLIAKDLRSNVIILRSIQAIMILFILIIILGLASEIFLGIFNGNKIDPQTVLLAAPFVFFSTIFLNFLFAGKRFTGM